MNGMVSRALELLRAGPTTVSALARELGSTEDEARSLIGILVSMAYVRELPTDCTDCSLGHCGDCQAKAGRSVSIKVYALTKKGSERS